MTGHPELVEGRINVSANTYFVVYKLENAIVPKEEIVSGCPPKDGIPALLEPKLIQIDKADFLKADDQVIGVRMGNQAKAYPIKILNWHEVVNDTIDGVTVVITF